MSPPVTMHWLGHAFYVAVHAGIPPPWIRLGEGVNVLVDLSDWPDEIGFAFKSDDDLLTEDFEDIVEALMKRWAPLASWVVDPGQEKMPEWIIQRIAVSRLHARTRRLLIQGYEIATNPWLNGRYASQH